MCALGIIDVPDVIFCALGLAVIIVVDILKEKKIDVRGWFLKQNYFVKTLIIAAIVAVIVLFGAYGDGYLPPDPIYGNF